MPSIGNEEGESLVEQLLHDVSALARDVAVDLGPDATAIAVEPVVRRVLEAIETGQRLSATELARLRGDGAAAAREGRPLAEPLDAYLSTTWVAWEHAVRLAAAAQAPQKGAAGTHAAGRRGDTDGSRTGELAALGSALLRAGDDIAAALADGYTGAERALAARAGATRRAVLDELLSPVALGPAGQARLARRATLVGLDPALPYGLALVRSSAELEEEGPIVEEVVRRLARDPARRSHLVSVRDGDLVVLVAGPWRNAAPLERAIADLPVEPWWAVACAPDGLAALPRHYADAIDALRVVPLCRPSARIHPVASVALERALVADPGLAAAGVDGWLGPLVRAGRGADALVPTLEAWFAEAGSVTGTARRLGIAPRTVTYRLARIARLLDLPDLDESARQRLGAALMIARLLGSEVVAPAGPDAALLASGGR